MAFNVGDFQDLVRLLEERPEWRAELRRQILTDQLLDLPATVQRLAEAQERTDHRLEQLAQRVEQLADAQQATEQRIEQLAEAHQATEQRLGELVGEVRQMAGLIGRHEGDLLELRYARQAPAYFGQLARRLRLVDSYRLADMLDDAIAEGKVSEEERAAVLAAALVLSGRRRDDQRQAYFVVELSARIERDDVARAIDSAQIVVKLGTPAVPVVAGNWIDLQAQQMAQDLGVERVLDGHAVREYRRQGL